MAPVSRKIRVLVVDDSAIVSKILTRLPANSPGVLITQHIPAVFSTAFARRLNDARAIEVKEAAHDDSVHPGRALLAPGNFHMVLRRLGESCRIRNG